MERTTRCCCACEKSQRKRTRNPLKTLPVRLSAFHLYAPVHTSCGHLNEELSLWQTRAFRPPGTIHACNRFLPKEIYVSVSCKTELPFFRDSLKRKPSDLFCQKRPCLVNRSGISEQRSEPRETRDRQAS